MGDTRQFQFPLTRPIFEIRHEYRIARISNIARRNIHFLPSFLPSSLFYLSSNVNLLPSFRFFSNLTFRGKGKRRKMQEEESSFAFYYWSSSESKEKREVTTTQRWAIGNKIGLHGRDETCSKRVLDLRLDASHRVIDARMIHRQTPRIAT